MKALLSIKPEYVNKIICGEKRFEYRKSIFKKDVTSVVIYATMPVGKIIGEFTIEEIINDPPETLWLKTYRYSGVSKSFFMQYFADRNKGFALKISDLQIYENPIDPKEIFDNFIPPQSFKYIEDDFAVIC